MEAIACTVCACTSTHVNTTISFIGVLLVSCVVFGYSGSLCLLSGLG